MKKRFALVVFLAVISTLLLSACGGTQASTTINLNMTDFAFDPKEISIPAGKEITITATNGGKVIHEFVIMNKGQEVSVPFSEDDEPKIYWEVEVKPGESNTVTFTAPAEAGDYQLICGTQGHVEAGMIGKLTVVP